jgi:hypothetical protein
MAPELFRTRVGTGSRVDQYALAVTMQVSDSVIPEQRARYGEYRRAMEARRQQMGLPS